MTAAKEALTIAKKLRWIADGMITLDAVYCSAGPKALKLFTSIEYAAELAENLAEEVSNG